MVDSDSFARWEPSKTMTQQITKHAYIGTYTQSERGEEHRKEGIYLCQVDSTTGQLSIQSKAVSNENPGFLRLHPNRRFLYAVNELVKGGVSSFAVDPSSGDLTLLNSQATDGVHPCFVQFDPEGKFMLVSNYSSGSLAVFPIRPDGKLDPHSDLVTHVGSGPNLDRQERAHAHSLAFDPSGKYVIAADLGIDRLLVYKLDTERGKLILNDLSGAVTQPGAGPRHFTFHPNGRILYSANELNGTVTVCSWDSSRGLLTPVQVVPTLPVEFKGENTVADIHLDPTAKTLYVSNRGHNSLAVFRIASDALLTPIGHVGCGGNWPRNFAVDPGGKWLYVANQYSNHVVTFQIDAKSGMPQETGKVLQVPSPVCIELVDF
jgi:6-phosphogluconolactonase